MKKNIRNCICLLGVFIGCALLIACFYIVNQKSLADTPVRVKEVEGNSVNVLSILDVSGVMKMTAVNYLPNEFAQLNEVVSNTGNEKALATRGTYRFYVDTVRVEEQDQVERLEHLLAPDGYWHLTLYIPPVFSACSIYVHYQNEAYIGAIDRYNVGYYISYSSPSEFDETVVHESETQPVFIDIPISAELKYSRECIITVHYESENENYMGISDGILIGEDAAVRKIVANNRSTVLIFVIVAAITFLLFLFICILKRSLVFVPQLILAASIFLMLITTYRFLDFTAAPYFVLAVRRAAVGLILFSSTLYLPKKLGVFPILHIAGLLAILACISAFITPFLFDVAAFVMMNRVLTALACSCIVIVLCFSAYSVFKGQSLGLRCNSVIAAELVLTVLLFNQSSVLTVLSPVLWLCCIMLMITLVLGFREFVSSEIHNRYLTNNLQQEVARQTQNLNAVISERDKILLYISHDMKKTVISMDNSLADLRQCMTKPELQSKVDQMLQKNAELKKDFADLSQYGKQNYIAEPSTVMDVCAVVRKVAEELSPDCEANGIVLEVSIPEKLDVYAKKDALESVIFNLIMNAIEHSYCSHLKVVIAKRKDQCRIDIWDDGLGIATEKNIFEPFVSGNPSENNSGLGLFLAKSAIESMHGKLTYDRKENCTIFTATLPLA